MTIQVNCARSSVSGGNFSRMKAMPSRTWSGVGCHLDGGPIGPPSGSLPPVRTEWACVPGIMTYHEIDISISEMLLSYDM